MKESCLKGCFCSKAAFTLMELLVVVLIIGILAAVAVPQYQKAVEKSKAAQVLGVLKSIHQAERAFYLSTGYYTNNLQELDIDLSWKGNEQWATNWNSSLSNDEWAFQTNVQSPGGRNVSIEALALGRLTGKYAGAGFIYILENSQGIDAPRLKAGLYCAERLENGKSIVGPGNYCQRIFNLTVTGTALSSQLYRM